MKRLEPSAYNDGTAVMEENDTGRYLLKREVDADKAKDAKRISELQDFCIWMTGCGYDFTQHKCFIEQRDKLLKGE